MKLRIMAIAICLILLLSIEGICEEKESDEIILSTVLKNENVVAINYWDINNETFLCIVTLHLIKIGDTLFPDRRLTFYKKTGDKLTKIFKFEPGDIFLNIYPLYDGNLMTIWGTASALRFYVFSFVGKEIKLVLDKGSKAMPEIADIDNDGEYEILIWYGNFEVPKTKENKKLGFFEKKRIFKWETADIYKWNGKSSYLLIKTLPWETRLNVLKGEMK